MKSSPDRIKDIRVLGCQVCEDIYRKAMAAELSEDESNYFVHLIMEFLIMGETKDIYTKLIEEP